MRKRILGLCLIAVAAIGWPLLLSARRQMDQSSDGEDKYVRLMSAQSVKLLEIDGRTYRKAEGPARFLHNNTWLICDTALWDVDLQIIFASGNVSIEQENTELTSDKLTYYVDRNLAEFRGSLVQLRDKDNNILRSHDLDYNTKDSLANFCRGASMRDKDGQLIESLIGTYQSKEHLFTFSNEVSMFTDSVFIKTTLLEYDTKTTIANFPEYVEAWKDDYMISADRGSYNRSTQYFRFFNNVHLMSETREGWSDTLYYDRGLNVLDMKGNAQVVDEERKLSTIAGHINYVDSLSSVKLLYDPVVLAVTEEKKDSLVSVPDSVYFRADTILYWSVKRCDVDSLETVLSAERVALVAEDPVMNIRKKAAEEAAQRAAEAAKNDPNRPPDMDNEQGVEDAAEEPVPDGNASQDVFSGDSGIEPSDSLSVVSDSLSTVPDSLSTVSDSLSVASDSLSTVSDSLSVASDSLSVAVDSTVVKDTTEISFLRAVGKVKLFRKSMQVACDSLVYSDLDSLARLYKEPLIWNEMGRHQYQSDSVWLVVRNNKMDKANLMSNAFVSINEDNVLFDQIRSAEMSAFFDEDSQLSRFDAMGDATALFYIKEKEKLSTANKKESTILSAMFEKGELQFITYYENPKSDVFPIAQMKQSDKQLKGFKWQGDLRPKSPSDITSRVFKETERPYYAARPKAEFPKTSKYFPGYIEKVYREIARADSLRKARSMAKPDTLALTDSTVASDSTVVGAIDSLSIESVDSSPDTVATAVMDTLALPAEISATDSTSVKDSLSATEASAVLTKEELAKKRREEADAKREARMAAREKRWEELDLRDSMKQAARDAKKHDRLEAKKAKLLARLQARKAREDAIREKYKQLYLTKWKNKLLKSTTTGSGAPSSSL